MATASTKLKVFWQARILRVVSAFTACVLTTMFSLGLLLKTLRQIVEIWLVRRPK